MEDDGRKSARYQCIDECLGEGSYGKVYIVEDVETGSVVAVKKQVYPSAVASRELAFGKVLASNPSVQFGRGNVAA